MITYKEFQQFKNDIVDQLNDGNVDAAVTAFWKAADHMNDNEISTMMQLIGMGA